MSIDNKKKLNKSHESEDQHDTRSTDVGPDIGNYQDLHQAEKNDTTRDFEVDRDQDFSYMGALHPDKDLDMDPTLKIKVNG